MVIDPDILKATSKLVWIQPDQNQAKTKVHLEFEIYIYIFLSLKYLAKANFKEWCNRWVWLCGFTFFNMEIFLLFSLSWSDVSKNMNILESCFIVDLKV